MIDDYHIRQYEHCYESTSGLLELMDQSTGGISTERILDVACGGGANVYHILKRWPGCDVTGVDLDEDALSLARSKVPPAFAARCHYERVNLFELTARYGTQAFDIITLMQTLLLFGPDEYPEVLEILMKTASRWVFLSSLFTDKRMDVTAQIRDYVRFGEETKETINYNTFCMSRFRRICQQLGAREVIFRDFWIGINLQAPVEGGIGTHTVKLEDGRRLQFSGAVFMPWKFVALRLR